MKFQDTIKQLKGRLDGKLKEQSAWRADVERYQKKADDAQSEIDEIEAAIAVLTEAGAQP